MGAEPIINSIRTFHDRVDTLAVGGAHTCVINRSNLDLICFGTNDDGQLDIPNKTETHEVHQKKQNKEYSHVAGGMFHTCVIYKQYKTDVKVENQKDEFVCFGNDSYNQTIVPLELLEKIPSVLHIFAGCLFNCALTQDGNPVCWGDNTAGQTDVPYQLQQKVKHLSLGSKHACALDKGGQMVCFGNNEARQLKLQSYILVPIIYSVECGVYHTCVIGMGGELNCFGRDVKGSVKQIPKQYLNGIVRMSLGFDFTCAVNMDMDVKCWGDDRNKKLDVPFEM